MQKIKIWDPATRLFHWLLVVCVLAMWVTAEQGDKLATLFPGIESTRVHAAIGYFLLGLIIFRILWGVVGSDTAQFSRFVRGPSKVGAYFVAARKGEKIEVIGHNPAGAWMVVLMLILLSAQLFSGLCAHNDVDFQGPLMALVGEDASHFFNKVHHLNFDFILVATALHIGAILFYRFVKRDDLIKPMITGEKEVEDGIETPRLRPVWMAIIVALIAAAVVWGLLTWAATLPPIAE